MKLYTSGQVVRAVLFSIAGTAILTVGILFFRDGKNNQISNNSKTEYSETLATSEEKNIVSLEKSDDASSASLAVATVSGYSQDEWQNINVYEKCNEAVVNINTKETAYTWFLEPFVQDGGSGSGSIIDAEGHILTNVHVIQNATKIYVSLHDGSQYEAKIVGYDLDSDLAVLKIDPPKGVILKTIEFGDSKKLKVGQKVIAIGNPFGMERTMTTGIVSGLGRPIQNSNKRIIRDMIQTDSAINPGNSGGPLLDTSGKMIGINTMILSSSGSSSGVGFAVSSETALRVVSDLLKYGKVNRGVIQASLYQLDYRIARYAGLDITQGMLVSEVSSGGNAEKAGLKGGTEAAYYGNRKNIIYLGGDVITQIDNIKITSLADYYSALEAKRPGDVVKVVVRRNRKDLVLDVKLAGEN
jgi:S1-C subfamily serine protease